MTCQFKFPTEAKILVSQEVPKLFQFLTTLNCKIIFFKSGFKFQIPYLIHELSKNKKNRSAHTVRNLPVSSRRVRRVQFKEFVLEFFNLKGFSYLSIYYLGKQETRVSLFLLQFQLNDLSSQTTCKIYYDFLFKSLTNMATYFSLVKIKKQ